MEHLGEVAEGVPTAHAVVNISAKNSIYTPIANQISQVIENGNVSRTAAADISGDWYGWWRMYGTSGEWAQMDGCWWDCCAEIKNGRILLWDEDLPKDNYLAKAELSTRGGEHKQSGII